MSLRTLADAVRDTLFRLLPHRAATGLVAIGSPGRDAAVLLSGNYALTLRRLRGVLRGRDVWLLVADSRGINVWCAASGGHLTHHDVISALQSSGIGERVDHRELILPQLLATGVERSRIVRATGWRVRWGPASLEDLPAFLVRGRRVLRSERLVRFPFRSRMEMALTWLFPMSLVLGPPVWALRGGAQATAAVGGAAALVLGTFACLPRVDLRERRATVFGAAGLVGFTSGLALLKLLVPALALADVLTLALAVALALAAFAVDFEGTTPWYGSVVNARGNPARIELDEARCTGAADCVQVCPEGVLTMDGRRRKAAIARPANCIQCGACIVQCPSDALRFRYADGRVAGPEVLRTTRLNMAGRRAVRVAD